MAIGLYGPEYLQFEGGGPAAEVRIFVFLPDTKIKAQLFADRTGLYTGPNPLFTDRRGELVFFTELGDYDLYYEFPQEGGTTVRVTVEDDGSDPGGPGDGRALGYKHTQNTSVNALSISHGLDFRPAGIVCLDTLGAQVDQDRVAYPAPGVIEIFFGEGFDFAGNVYLS